MNRIKYTDIIVSELASLPSGGIKIIDDSGETIYEGPFVNSTSKLLEEAYAIYMAPDEYRRFRESPHAKVTRREKVQ